MSNQELPVRERPILFSAHMVRAILDGSKTQTRRIVKGPLISWLNNANGSHKVLDGRVFNYSFDQHLGDCPYGQPGDRLWVRETFAHIYRGNAKPENILPGDVVYKADGFSVDPYVYGLWKPSIHIPRWASRIDLLIKSVRVEHLQDISEADAESEGVDFLRAVPDADETMTARELFEALWSSINGDASWEANPWVWVVEFERVKP